GAGLGAGLCPARLPRRQRRALAGAGVLLAAGGIIGGRPGPVHPGNIDVAAHPGTLEQPGRRRALPAGNALLALGNALADRGLRHTGHLAGKCRLPPPQCPARCGATPRRRGPVVAVLPADTGLAVAIAPRLAVAVPDDQRPAVPRPGAAAGDPRHAIGPGTGLGIRRRHARQPPAIILAASELGTVRPPRRRHAGCRLAAAAHEGPRRTGQRAAMCLCGTARHLAGGARRTTARPAPPLVDSATRLASAGRPAAVARLLTAHSPARR